MDGKLSWTSINYCSSNSNDMIENWKHKLYEVSTRKFARVTKYVRWIGYKVWELPKLDGLGEIEEFIDYFEGQVLGEVRIQDLDIALKATQQDWGGHISKSYRHGIMLRN